MKVSCQQCGASYSVADDKVSGRKVRLRCKKCGESIVLDNTGADLQLGSVTPSTDTDDASPAWHVSIGDAAQGPYTLDELRGYLASGSIGADALVYREGWPDWKALPEVDALKAARPRTSRPPALRQHARRPSLHPEPSMGSDPFDDAPQSPSPRVSDADLLSGIPREGTVQFSVDQIRALSAVSMPPVMSAQSKRTPGYASGSGSGLIDVASLVAGPAEGFKPITSADLSPIDTMAPMALPTFPHERGRIDFRTKVIAGVLGLGMVLTALVVTVALVTRRPVATAVAPQPVAEPTQAAAPAQTAIAQIAQPPAAAAPIAAKTPVPATAQEKPIAATAELAATEAKPHSKARTSVHHEQLKTSSDDSSRHAGKHAAPSKHESEPLAAVTSPKPTATKTSAADIDALIAKDPERTPKKGASASIDDLLDGAVSAKKQPPKSESEPKASSGLPQTPSRDEMSAAYSKAKAKVAGCKGSGVASAMITVSGSGRASSVSVSGVEDPAKSCVEKAVRSTPFPKFQKDSFEVKFPFKLGG